MMGQYINRELSFKAIRDAKLFKDFEYEITDGTSVLLRKMITGTNVNVDGEIIHGNR